MNMPGGWLALVSCVAGALLAVGVTWLACRWWYGKKLVAAAQRLHKSDQGRLFSHQQTVQARRQIELLKAELDVLRKASVDSQAHRQRTRELETALSQAERAAEEEMHAPPPAAHGFADTQILP